MYIYSFVCIFPYIFSTIEQSYIISNEYGRVAKLGIFASVISFVTKLALLYFDFSIEYIILFNYLDVIIVNLLLLYNYHSRQEGRIIRGNKNLSLILIKSSFPLFLTGIISVLYVRVDQFIIINYLGAESNAIYGLAIKFIEPLFLVGIVLSNYYTESITRKSICGDIDSLVSLFSKFSILAIFLIIIVNIFGSLFIARVFGIEYSESANILVVLSLSLIFQFWLIASAKCLIARNMQNIALIRNLAALSINIILGLYLVKLWGLYGVAISTLISYSVAGLFSDLISKKTRYLFFIKLKSLSIRWKKL
jgi:O-antigen/teichoic acid export membrane protein